MQRPYSKLPGKQRGAVLVVALIMLVLLSLLGVNSLKTALHTERMSSAVHQKNITFQASESAAALASLQNSQIANDAILTNGPITRDVDTGSNLTRTSVTVVPLGSGPVLGTSFGVGGGLRLLITSTAELSADSGAQTVTVHGITRLGP